MKRLTLAMALVFGGIVPAMAHDIEYQFRVDGMTCPFCAATSEAALRDIDGVSSANADLDAGLIRVCARHDLEFTDDQLTDLFLDRGFTYVSMTRLETCGSDDT